VGFCLVRIRYMHTGCEAGRERCTETPVCTAESALGKTG
jgi:hypothetical protein